MSESPLQEKMMLLDNIRIHAKDAKRYLMASAMEESKLFEYCVRYQDTMLADNPVCGDIRHSREEAKKAADDKKKRKLLALEAPVALTPHPFDGGSSSSDDDCKEPPKVASKGSTGAGDCKEPRKVASEGSTAASKGSGSS